MQAMPAIPREAVFNEILHTKRHRGRHVSEAFSLQGCRQRALRFDEENFRGRLGYRDKRAEKPVSKRPTLPQNDPRIGGRGGSHGPELPVFKSEVVQLPLDARGGV